MSIKSKSLRFTVFKRDKFKCVYCGDLPSNTTLHIDHVIPRADGGTDDLSNLVTACAKCNLGKGRFSLNKKMLNKVVETEIEKVIIFLKNRRISLGLSQNDLAKLAGLHRTEINRIESARNKPLFANIKRIAEALGLILTIELTPKTEEIKSNNLLQINLVDSKTWF